MINVGIAGIGFMGMTHYNAYQKIKGAKVRALCEQDSKRLSGDWRAIKGNFGPTGTLMDLSGISKYEKVDDLLADPKIDMVDICLPPGAHANVAIAALRSGKHVFCEKPIALSAADAKRMVKTAGQQGRQLMIGHVLPFFPEFAYAYQTVRGGKYGRLLGGHFKRITADPLWLKDFWDPRRVGGPMIDLHIHDAHFIRLLCGMPTAVFSSGRMRGEVAEFFTSQFQFADPTLSVTATSGAIQQQGRAFTHGYEIHLERATLLYDFSVIGDQANVSMPVTLLTSDGKVTRPKIDSSDPTAAFASELTHAVKMIRTGQQSEVLNGSLACDALVLCDKETLSVKERRLVKV
jgi:predicted dehydrogenase